MVTPEDVPSTVKLHAGIFGQSITLVGLVIATDNDGGFVGDGVGVSVGRTTAPVTVGVVVGVGVSGGRTGAVVGVDVAVAVGVT